MTKNDCSPMTLDNLNSREATKIQDHSIQENEPSKPMAFIFGLVNHV